jgi:general secretion pathway protein A
LHTVRLVALARLWRGEFATYWRASAADAGELHEGSSGPAIEQLARQLATLDGTAARTDVDRSHAQIFDAALRERVRAFQRAQGLKPDGLPGPMTLMQLDSATGGTEPRLQTE